MVSRFSARPPSGVRTKWTTGEGKSRTGGSRRARHSQNGALTLGTRRESLIVSVRRRLRRRWGQRRVQEAFEPRDTGIALLVAHIALRELPLQGVFFHGELLHFIEQQGSEVLIFHRFRLAVGVADRELGKG